MRRLLAVALLLSCAHGPRRVEPERWVEVQTEHFVLRTDLSREDARQTAIDLEEVRAALLAAGWHSGNLPKSKTQVIALADDRELQDYAMKGIQGFFAPDAFGEPVVVISGSQGPEDQRFLKHELAHAISNQFLVRNPRWMAEGLACYLETLRFDRKRGKVVVGEMSADRLEYLRDSPVPNYWAILLTGREAEHMSARQGWAFETGAWVLVHWLVDERGEAFDSMLERLSKGEDQHYAFSKAFPDLTETSMKAGVAAYLKGGKIRIFRAEASRWQGDVDQRMLPAGEVYAILADLQRLSPGHARTVERELRKQSLLAQSLQADPGNPLAIQLSEDLDPAAATKAHPDDWRAWLVFADKHDHDLTALQTAHKLAPENPAVLDRLSWAEARNGDRAAALRHATRAVEIAPGRSDLLAALGGVLVDAARCPDGLRSIQRALDVLPDGADPAAIGALKKTQRLIEEHCEKVSAVCTVERRVIGAAKGCDPKGLRFGKRDKVKGTVTAEFVLREDGKVVDVEVKVITKQNVAEFIK